jgi:hypothetical protein
MHALVRPMMLTGPETEWRQISRKKMTPYAFPKVALRPLAASPDCAVN